MVIDRLGEFATGNAPTDALTASGALTNVLDFGPVRNMGTGKPLYVTLQLVTAADATNGDETYSFAIQTDDNSGFSSATTIGTLTVPRGSAAGTKFTHSVSNAVERYLRVNATLGGTTPSVTVKAWLSDHLPSNWSATADGI